MCYLNVYAWQWPQVALIDYEHQFLIKSVWNDCIKLLVIIIDDYMLFICLEMGRQVDFVGY